MLDVLHFIFEEDSTHVSEESAASRSGVRKVLYRDMYGVPYDDPYENSKRNQAPKSPADYPIADDSDLGIMDDADAAKPFSPREMKPEMKPALGMDSVTQFDPDAKNPFSGILDAPAG